MKNLTYILLLTSLLVGCKSRIYQLLPLVEGTTSTTMRYTYNQKDTTYYQEQTYWKRDGRVVLSEEVSKVPLERFVTTTLLLNKTPNEQRYVTIKRGEEIAYQMTKQNQSLLTETFFWTINSDDEPRKLEATYTTIDGKPYLKQLTEFVPDGAELYRLVFDYTDFLKGRLTITQYRQGEPLATDRYKIAFNRHYQSPDVLLSRTYPLRMCSEFVRNGQMGTFDYYVVEADSELEQTTYNLDYFFDQWHRPIRIVLTAKHKKFDRFYRQYFTYSYTSK